MMKGARHRDWSWWGEMSGAAGDLGILLPLAIALAASAGFGLPRLFLLWGLAYIATGLWFRIPVSVQPLKAMAVIAIASGMGAPELSNVAVGYGLLFCVLAATGLVQKIHDWFSAGLVRGVQLGIGLVLLRKSLALLSEGRPLIGPDWREVAGPAACTLAVVFILVGARRRWGLNLTLAVLGLGILAGFAFGTGIVNSPAPPLLDPTMPDPARWGQLFLILMLPQLPLTLGNAVVAASETCHELWPHRADRVSPRSLAISIGVANLTIGGLGGFPMCHGAGGIAAHHRFGGRTGRTTLILGVALIVAALVPAVAGLFLRVPVAVLAALLMMVAWEMIRLVGRPAPRIEFASALITGGIAFAAGHLAVGLAAGWLFEVLTGHRGHAAPGLGAAPGESPKLSRRS